MIIVISMMIVGSMITLVALSIASGFKGIKLPLHSRRSCRQLGSKRKKDGKNIRGRLHFSKKLSVKVNKDELFEVEM